MAKELTDKQTRFVEEYLVDLNASQAASRAGYSEKTANRIAAENMQKPAIKAAIRKEQSKISHRIKLSTDRILIEEACIATSDIRQLFDVDGNLIPADKLPGRVARAVATYKVTPTPDGDKIDIRFWDKGRALERLEKVMGMFDQAPEKKELAPLPFSPFPPDDV